MKIFKMSRARKQTARNRMETREKVRGSDKEYYEEFLKTFNSSNEYVEKVNVMKDEDYSKESTEDLLDLLVSLGNLVGGLYPFEKEEYEKKINTIKAIIVEKTKGK